MPILNPTLNARTRHQLRRAAADLDKHIFTGPYYTQLVQRIKQGETPYPPQKRLRVVDPRKLKDKNRGPTKKLKQQTLRTIQKAIRNTPQATSITSLAKQLHLNYRTTRYHLEHLRHKGLIHRTKSPSSRRYVYSIRPSP